MGERKEVGLNPSNDVSVINNDDQLFTTPFFIGIDLFNFRLTPLSIDSMRERLQCNFRIIVTNDVYLAVYFIINITSVIELKLQFPRSSWFWWEKVIPRPWRGSQVEISPIVIVSINCTGCFNSLQLNTVVFTFQTKSWCYRVPSRIMQW